MVRQFLFSIACRSRTNPHEFVAGINDTQLSCADVSCAGGSSCLQKAAQSSPKKFYDLYHKRVEFGLMSQAKRNEQLVQLLNTFADHHTNWFGVRMCACFSAAIGVSQKRLREKLVLVTAGGKLARKLGSGQRDGPKTQQFLGYLENLRDNHSEKNPKGGEDPDFCVFPPALL